MDRGGVRGVGGQSPRPPQGGGGAQGTTRTHTIGRQCFSSVRPNGKKKYIYKFLVEDCIKQALSVAGVTLTLSAKPLSSQVNNLSG